MANASTQSPFSLVLRMRHIPFKVVKAWKQSSMLMDYSNTTPLSTSCPSLWHRMLSLAAGEFIYSKSLSFAPDQPLGQLYQYCLFMDVNLSFKRYMIAHLDSPRLPSLGTVANWVTLGHLVIFSVSLSYCGQEDRRQEHYIECLELHKI